MYIHCKGLKRSPNLEITNFWHLYTHVLQVAVCRKVEQPRIPPCNHSAHMRYVMQYVNVIFSNYKMNYLQVIAPLFPPPKLAL